MISPSEGVDGDPDMREAMVVATAWRWISQHLDKADPDPRSLNKESLELKRSKMLRLAMYCTRRKGWVKLRKSNRLEMSALLLVCDVTYS